MTTRTELLDARAFALGYTYIYWDDDKELVVYVYHGEVETLKAKGNLYYEPGTTFWLDELEDALDLARHETFIHDRNTILKKSVGDFEGKKLPAYAWPGGYSISYITASGLELCSECAEEDEEVIGTYVDEEQSSILCDECGKTIDKAKRGNDD